MVNDVIHTDLKIKKGDFFVKNGQRNTRIGKLMRGVLRGFTINEEGEEITTHFFIEEDLVSGNYIPNVPATISIQALEDSFMSVASYTEVFSHVNTDFDLTKTILSKLERLNIQNHSRIEVLITCDAQKKYSWFLKAYPNLLNRIPHYLVASFLGITPTQLSRIRKALFQQM